MLSNAPRSPNRRQRVGVVGTKKADCLNFVIRDFSFSIDNDDAARRASGKPGLEAVFGDDFARFVREKREREIVFCRKILVRRRRIGRDADDFRARSAKLRPIIAHRT